jgi:hypothetical protein
VAAALNRVGLGTLLVDLLTADEELSRAYVFNIAMLAGRLAGITRWPVMVPDCLFAQAEAGWWMLVAMTPRAAPQRRARDASPSSSVFCWPTRKLSGAAMRG